MKVKHGKYSKKTLDLYRRAREFSAQSTFTEELAEGSLTKGMQTIINQHPIFKTDFTFYKNSSKHTKTNCTNDTFFLKEMVLDTYSW